MRLLSLATIANVSAANESTWGRGLREHLRSERVLNPVNANFSCVVKPYGLTPRELEIVDAITAGDSNRDIAARRNISLQTVKHHLTSVFAKTGTSTRLEPALFAIRQGVVNTK